MRRQLAPIAFVLLAPLTAAAQAPDAAPTPAPDSAPKNGPEAAPKAPPAEQEPPKMPASSEPAPEAPKADPPDRDPPKAPPPPPEHEPEPAKKEPPEVRVLGDRADALQRIPGSGTVISAQEIQRANPSDVAEVLRRAPGVQVRQEYSGGMRLDIGVRGLDPGRSRQVLVLEDGIPIAANPYGEPDIFYLIAVERVRAIEVVKGSGNILFGPRTIGGVINFLTLTPPATPQAVMDVEGGNGKYIRGLARYGDTFGSARYVVQALHRRADGFQSEPYNSTDLMGKVAFDTSDKGEAIVKVGFHDDSAVSPTVGLTRQMFITDPRRPTFAPGDQANMRRYEVSLIHDQRFSEKTKLRTLLYAYANTRSWRRGTFDRTPQPGAAYDRIVGDPSVPNAAIYFTGTNGIQDWSYQVAGVEPRLEHRFETGTIGHTVDIGARLLGETASYQLSVGETPTSLAGALNGDERHRTVAFAGYFQDRIAVLENLLVTPGIRVEHADFHQLILRRTDATGGHDVSIPGDKSVTGVIPGAGAVYGSRDANVFAGVHYGWGPPRVADSFGVNGTPKAVSAEESINYEIGARAFFKKWLRAETTGFYSTFTNQVVSGGPVGAALVDGGPTEHIGVESAAVAGIGKALKWATIVDLTARYTFARATFSEGAFNGKLVPYAPLHTFSTNVDVEHPVGIGGQVAWTHVESQFSDFADTVAANASGEFGQIPSYDSIDATAHYRHKPTGLTFKLTVKNLLDTPYIAARRPQGIDVKGFRQIFLGLRWEYEKAQPVP